MNSTLQVLTKGIFLSKVTLQNSHAENVFNVCTMLLAEIEIKMFTAESF